MPFRGTADPKQLAMLKRVLEEHCVEAGIADGSMLKDGLAMRILYLFQNGVSNLEALKEALRQDRAL